jgi:hypothetical protein
LDGGAGSGADTLIGGAGSDTLYYSGALSAYDGGGGTSNEIAYRANPGDLIAVMAPALVVNNDPKNLRSVTRIETFRVAGNPASVNNGRQRIWPLDGYPLTSTGVGVQATAGTPVTTLTATFTHANPTAAATMYAATIDWGDGTRSTVTSTASAAGQIVPNGGGAFTVTGYHAYASNEPHAIYVQIVVASGAATSAGTKHIGGLELAGNGDLRNYIGSDYTVLDSGVKAFLVRYADTTLFSLHTNTGLYSISGSNLRQIDGGVQTIVLGPDGTLYARHGDGNLYAAALASTVLQFSDDNVQTILQDNGGTLYKLRVDGDLYVNQSGSNWVVATENVTSISLNADGSGVEVIGTDGKLWEFRGAAGRLIRGPQFSLTSPNNIAAGQAVPLTVRVLDARDNPVTAYLGTVRVASSDIRTEPLPEYTFTSADAGTRTFNVPLKTLGSQTITVAATDTSAESVVTVNPAPAAFFGVTVVSPAAVVGSPVDLTVTAYDAYGNVASGYTGTVHFTSTDGAAVLPADYTFQAGHLGTHTFTGLIFNTVGGQSVTATDTRTASITGGAAVGVSPAALDLSRSSVTVVPPSIPPSGRAFVTLTARDVYGNLQAGGGAAVAFQLGSGIVTGTFSTVTDNGDGTYTALLTAGPTTGTNTVRATINNQPVTSPAASIAVNNTSLLAPAITGIVNDTGASANDGITSDQTLLIVGTAQANATVQVYRGGTGAGSTAADAAGRWTFDYTGTTLAEGTYQFTARAMDVAGNLGPSSAAFSVTVDTTPLTASIAPVTPDPRNTPAGTVTITFSALVTGVDLADFSLTRNGTAVSLTGLAVGGSGTSYTLDLSTKTVADGAYVLTLAAAGSEIRDAAGNPLADSAVDTFAVHPWHNYDNPYNVNGVGGVTPLDALLVINYINRHPGETSLPAMPPSPPLYVDVTGGSNGEGDLRATPLDVLAVINYINSHSQGSSEGEASPEAATPATEPVLISPEFGGDLVGSRALVAPMAGGGPLMAMNTVNSSRPASLPSWDESDWSALRRTIGVPGAASRRVAVDTILSVADDLLTPLEAILPDLVADIDQALRSR